MRNGGRLFFFQSHDLTIALIPCGVVCSAVNASVGSSTSVDWSPSTTADDSSVINDLTISAPRQQPKYSYLVGRSNTNNDLWRTTLPTASTSSNQQQVIHWQTQLSNLWRIPNSVSKGFDTAMWMGSSRRFKRYPTTYMWVSSQLPFTEV